MRMHSSDAAIRAARLSPRLQAAQHLPERRACHPHACCACPSAAPQVYRLCLKGHDYRRTPLLRVNSAHAPAAAASPHVGSDSAFLTSSASACLSSGPPPPSPLHGHCGDPTAIATSALLLTGSHALLLEGSKPPTLFLQQLARAGRRPAAESAHNKTLQSRFSPSLLAEMRLNRALMERSINSCICL